MTHCQSQTRPTPGWKRHHLRVNVVICGELSESEGEVKPHFRGDVDPKEKRAGEDLKKFIFFVSFFRILARNLSTPRFIFFSVSGLPRSRKE